MSFFKSLDLVSVKPDTLIPKCGECGLYKTCKSPKMEPSGKGRRRVLIVAEAPGREEDDKGIQLIGKSGKLLSSVLDNIGVNMRKDCWITNALICRPIGNEITNPKAIDFCRPNLIKTIKNLDPDIIIPLGARAVESLISHLWSPIGKDEIKRWVGWRIPAQRINAWVCPTYHPSYLLREENPVLDNYFAHHLHEAFKLEGKPWDVVPDYEKQIKLLYKKSQIISFLDAIEDGVVAFDFETNMLKPEGDKARIVSCSVCFNGETTVAFPLLPGVEPSLCRLLTDKRVAKIAQNMKFEDRWTRTILKKQVRNWRWDTMLSAHILDCRHKVTGLKFLSFVHLGQRRYDAQVEPYLKDAKAGYSENKIDSIPLEKLLIYNGMDSLLEYLVAEKQLAEMGVDMR